MAWNLKACILLGFLNNELMLKAHQIQVRRLSMGDLPSYKAIRLEAVKLEPTSFGGSYEEEVGLPNSFYEAQFSEVWATDDSGVFGAFDQAENLVGIVGLFKRGGRKLSHKAILWGMYVRPAVRNRGIGHLLLETVLEFAKSMNAEFVDLTVADSNTPAIRTYEKSGFRAWGVEPAALKIGDEYFDEQHMTLKIT